MRYIRHALPSDVPQLAVVEETCFPTAEAASAEQFAARVAAYGSHFWLLFDKHDRLLSFVDGLVTDKPDLCDEMYENAALHNEDGAWQMIFGVNTVPEARRQGCAERLLRQCITDARTQGRRGLVLTCKEVLLHYYGKFGFVSEGVTEKSTHGGVQWYQMRLTFREEGIS